METVSEIIVALIAAGAAIGAALIARNRKRERKKNRLPIYVDHVNEIYLIIQNLLIALDAQRVAVVKSENGGGIPSTSGHLYGSVLYEDVAAGVQRVKRSWQRQPLDRAYFKMLKTALDHDRRLFYVKDLEAGILKDVYESHRTIATWLCVIARQEKQLIYLSVNFGRDKHDSDLNTPEIREALRMTVAQLDDIFK